MNEAQPTAAAATDRMLYVHARSPIHTGTGQSSGAIDLPVARERLTNWPYLPGSTLKGVLSAACRDAVNGKTGWEAICNRAFGQISDDSSSAGWLGITDALLLCLPVHSLYGSFAWVTCPLALERWKRDHEDGGLSFSLTIPRCDANDRMLVAETGSQIVQGGKVFLSDLNFEADLSDDATALAKAIAGAVFSSEQEWRTLFEERFAIVSNDVFTFLTESSTDVAARIKLTDESKTVDAQGGALWYQEAVPVESIFTAALPLFPRGKPAQTTIDEIYSLVSQAVQQTLQLGGSASVGKGLVRLAVRSEASA